MTNYLLVENRFIMLLINWLLEKRKYYKSLVYSYNETAISVSAKMAQLPSRNKIRRWIEAFKGRCYEKIRQGI